MSKCTACLQNMCRKHPLQDHGEREKKIKALAKSSATSFLKRSYEELIRGQIDKMEADANVGSKEELTSYKISMEEEREKASKRERRKFSSDEHEELSRKSGLNPAVLATMLADSDSDSDENRRAGGTSENEKEISEKRSRKSKKKSKKEKNEKKSKKEKKSSRRKEDKKSTMSPYSSSDSESEGDSRSRISKQNEPTASSTCSENVPPRKSSDSSSYYGLV